MRRAHPEEQAPLLKSVLARLKAAGPRAVCAFDLDSTLLDNRPRQALILREFGEARGVPVLTQLQPEHWDGWDIKVAMRNAGLPAGEVEALAEEAKAFWRQRFFTSEYCVHDQPIAGAGTFLASVHDTGATVAYVTGRHEAMRPGCVESFRRCGLLLPGPRVALLMKPTFEESDDAWKKTAHESLRRLGEVEAAFDNEPAHANGYRESFPGAMVIHLDTDHSGRPIPLLPGIPSVLSFSL